MPKILIIRFSALGDVAMTIPVIYSLAEQHPELEITVLSRRNFEPLFQSLPNNVSFLGIDLKQYKGISGLNTLFKELHSHSFDYVADFHGVLRTHFLRLRFKLKGYKTAVINKGKRGKRRLTRRYRKVLQQQETSFARYKNVCEKLGFPINLNFQSIYDPKTANIDAISSLTGTKEKDKWLGVAPFAKHKGKIYPLLLQEKVLTHFAQRKNTKIFLFGGGKEEKQQGEIWEKNYPNLISVIGQLSMQQELALLSNVDVVLSMDSANMHLASLVNTPVVSIWGATHPFAGFLGWNQKTENTVQIDLVCRPCSVFGEKPCFRGDYACLYEIKPHEVVKKIERIFETKNQN